MNQPKYTKRPAINHKQVFKMYARAGGRHAFEYWNEFLRSEGLERCDNCGLYGYQNDPMQPIEAGGDYLWHCSRSCESRLREAYAEIITEPTPGQE